MNKLGTACLGIFAATCLVACSGGGGSDTATAPLTLSVTDAPIDQTTIDSVCVDFTRITVHYADQPDVVLDYSPLASQVSATTHCLMGVWNGSPPVPPVRLNALGGPLTVALAESLQVPVGRITWIRLHFTDGSYVLDSMGGQHDLRCPSCEPTDNNAGRGFKLNRTFDVGSGGLALTVDIDLLKSLHMDNSGYVLRPTARIENTGESGTIAGRVDADIVTAEGGTLFNGTTVETGCAVYAYAGHDVTPDDYYDGSPVIAGARLLYSQTFGDYRYAIGALAGGTAAVPEQYTTGLTCDADDPLVNEDGNGVHFIGGRNADVVTGLTTTVDFVIP